MGEALVQNEQVDAQQARAGSGQMFDRIAARYDALNRVMSLGLDRRWRQRLVQALGVSGSGKILDVATGTADVAIAVAHKYPRATVVGLDPSGRMLAIGQEKIRLAGLESQIRLVEGDAQALPFESGHFDATCIAFGIRNVPDRAKGLREMVRVTKAGGRVVVLELTEPNDGLLRPITRFHVHKIVPRLGAWLSGEREYKYLAKSVADFPKADVFATMLSEAGLKNVSIDRLSFGAVYLYRGEV